ncbi:hypothetical protein OBBRIDRAFT_693559, partial [Obba rivulosa]
VGDATRIWEVNIHWPLAAQCCTWDQKSMRADIWECIREHKSTPGTQPPNSYYWRYVTRR